MNKITLFPCAKINLGLNITRKRSDGYHDLETVFCPVPIADILTIEKNGKPAAFLTRKKVFYFLQYTILERFCQLQSRLINKKRFPLLRQRKFTG